MNITNRFRQVFAELRTLPRQFSAADLREFYERYMPQPSMLELARIRVSPDRRRAASARQRPR